LPQLCNHDSIERDDLPEIVHAFTHHTKVPFITLPTNAFLPERVIPATEKMVVDAPNTRFNLCLSIDGIEEEHDDIRVVEGGMKKLKETFRAAVKMAERYDNLEVHTTTVLSTLNASHIDEILDWIKQEFGEAFPEVLLCRGSAADQSTKDVDLATYERSVKKIAEMSRAAIQASGFKPKVITSLTNRMSEVLIESEKRDAMVVPCTAGKKLIIMRPDGRIDPCEGVRGRRGAVTNGRYDLSADIRRSPTPHYPRGAREADTTNDSKRIDKVEYDASCCEGQ